jgi:hypothetical protein
MAARQCHPHMCFSLTLNRMYREDGPDLDPEVAICLTRIEQAA